MQESFEVTNIASGELMATVTIDLPERTEEIGWVLQSLLRARLAEVLAPIVTNDSLAEPKNLTVTLEDPTTIQGVLNARS